MSRMTWTDLYDRAEAVARRMLGGVADEGTPGAGGVPADDEETRRMAERLMDSGRLYARLLARERYDYRKAYARLMRMERRRRVARRVSLWGSVAACLAVAVVVAFWPEAKEEPRMAERFEPVREVKAILVRADGEEYRLDAAERRLADGQGVTLSADSSGLRYEAKEAAAPSDSVAYNSLRVPRGGVYQLTLADGTAVWLNSDSRLEYPEAFSGDTREVRLRGEAYFDVARDTARPFVVATELGDVTVLGTEFNVKYYPEEERLATTLVEGSVSFANEVVDATRLRPGCQLVFERGGRDVSVERVNVRYYVAWKDDVLNFQNERLADIMRTLSRWYDVQIVFESEELKNLVFSGNLDKYDTIESFFKLFEASSDVRFETLGNSIYVRKKR